MGGKPDNSAALKESRLSREESSKQFREQQKLLKAQMEQASEIPVIPFSAPSAAPTTSSADVIAAGREQRQQARRRYGFQKSVSPASTAPLGGSTAL